MLFTIAVCYGDENLLNFLAEYCKELQLNVVALAASGEELIEITKEFYPDIILLDVELPGINGIDAAREITKSNYLTKVIFISNSSKYYKKAVDIYCYDYIPKTLLLKRLAKTINRLKRELSLIKQKASIEKIKLKINRNEILINVNDIIYIQRVKRKIEILLKENTYSIYDSIKNWEKALSSNNNFFKCHQSYIVNLNKVNSFEKDQNKLHMSNGGLVTVSKRKTKSLIYKFDSLFKQI